MDDLFSLAKAALVSFAALLPVLNPVGTPISPLGLTAEAGDATRRQIARLEEGIACMAAPLL